MSINVNEIIPPVTPCENNRYFENLTKSRDEISKQLTLFRDKYGNAKSNEERRIYEVRLRVTKTKLSEIDAILNNR